MIIQISKCIGCSESRNKREAYIIIGLSQERREIPSKWPKELHVEELKKKTKEKLKNKISRKKEII